MAANVIAKADGPFLTSGTFDGTVDGSPSNGYQQFSSGAVDIGTAWDSTTSFQGRGNSTFDGPLGVSTDGVMLYLEQKVGATGTFTVETFEIGGSIQGTVVVNVGDLPASGSPKWTFFKYAAPYVTNNAFYHNIRFKSSVNATVRVWGSATTNDIAFLTRKTTVAAVPVTGDTAFIVGELTGPGTGTDRYVTPGVEAGITVTVGTRGFHSAPPAPPTVTSVSANGGPTAGGTAVTITGTGFSGVTGVTFGGVAATSVVTVNATTVTCTTPAHAAGAVNVVVTNGDGQTGTGTNAFTYAVPATSKSIPAIGIGMGLSL